MPEFSHANGFPTTQWTIIARSGDADEEVRRKALGELCELYWPPVYSYFRCQGKSPGDAEDLTQGLFADLLERGTLGKADSQRGKLRTLLLSVARNHMVSGQRHDRRLKRGGHSEILSIDAMEAESRCITGGLVDDLSPDLAFDRQWAISLMESVVNGLMHHYAESGRAELFAALRPYIQIDQGTENQRHLAARLNMKETALRVAIHRLRQRYADAMRREVRSTLGSDECVEDELETLLKAFAS